MTGIALRRIAWVLAACGVGISCAGCSSGPKNFENENDRLRRRTMELESQVKDLTAQNAELTVKVHELSRVPPNDRLRPEVIDALPRCASLEIGRLSGLVDADGVPGLDAADVYVRPLDGKGRFTQVSGWMAARVALLPEARPGEGSAGEPVLLGSVRLSPGELREAYRSSFTGTHYSIRVALTNPNQPLAGVVTLTVTLEDGVTGSTLTAAATRVLEPVQ